MKLTRAQFLKTAPFLAPLAGSVPSLTGSDTEAPALIPRPKNFQLAGGVFHQQGPIAFNLPAKAGLKAESVRLALSGLKMAEHPSAAPPEEGLRLIIENPGGPGDAPEVYSLLVESKQITVKARSAAGLRMGLCTLGQLATQGNVPQCNILDWPDMKTRSAHLCYHLVRETLAYNAPNFESLLEQIDQLAALKYNAVLLELESLFPYQKHPLIPCKIAFTQKQIAALRDRLETHGMEIVPIVQCLGHAYNVLIHDQYTTYAEVPGTFQQFCPTNPKLPDLYMEFVDEYREAFPGMRQWHVGGDESWQLGQCERCKAKVQRSGVSALYVEYVSTIAERLRSRGLAPMVWSDMMESHPEAIPQLPKDIKIVYWNYDMPNWLRPYAVDQFLPHGFQVVGAPAVRFGGTGTDLSVFYPPALRGIETLIPRMHQQGTSEMIVTNWTKGSPHEMTHYGFAYGADRCWNTAGTRDEFQKRYARLSFGSDDPAICGVYETLSIPLPYAEPVSSHQADKLNRFNLSGFRFAAKSKRYTAHQNEPRALDQLRQGISASSAATEALNRLEPGCKRGKRQIELFRMSASCIQTKARFGLALHEGRKLEESHDRKGVEQWLSEAPSIVKAWQKAKAEHRQAMEQTGFTPVIEFLNDLLFEPDELAFFKKMADGFAAL